MQNKPIYKHQEASKHLSEYYFVFLKHKWLIIAVCLITVLFAVYHNLMSLPIYKTYSSIVIDTDQKTSPITGQIMNYESYFMGTLTFNTHFKLITSRPVLERVVESLKLTNIHQEDRHKNQNQKTFFSTIHSNLNLLLGKQEKSSAKTDSIPQQINALKNKIKIEHVEDTRILKINVSDTDPTCAKNIANTLAKAYIDFNIENHLRSSRSTLSWMTDQLYEMKKKLEDSEKDFLAYKQKEKIFSLAGRQDLNSKKIADFNESFLEARNKRLEIDSKLKELKPSAGSEPNILYARSVILNPVIDSLYSQLLDLEVEISRLKKVYKLKHPKLIQTKTELENTEKKLHEEVLKEVENLKFERSILFAKENILQKTIADFENEALDTNQKEMTYKILQRNVETNQKLYDILLAKVKESNIIDNTYVSNIRIIEKAVIPKVPVPQYKILIIIMGLVFGFLGGLGLVLFLEYLDRSLRTEEDVHKYIGLPVLGVIPGADRNITGSKGQKRSNKKNSNPTSEFFLNYLDTNSSFAESYRTLRTNIDLAFIDKDFRTFLITSAAASEGKTLTVANLSHTITKRGKTVLMIDGDLRNPMLSRFVGANESPGITGLFSETFNTQIQNGYINEKYSISDIFRLLSFQKQTGHLHLSNEEKDFELFFFKGELADLNWLNRPNEKRLAATLIANGKITKEQAQKAIDKQKGAGQKLGFILINMGLVSKKELIGPLTIHMLEGLRAAIHLKSGKFSFKKISPSDFDKSSFDPIDFNALYSQVILGEEKLPFIEQQVNSAILKTDLDGLLLLPCGDIPPVPSELLASDRMSFLISFLKQKYDMLIVDSSPVIPTSDALNMATHMDGVLVISRSGMMNRKMVIKTIEQLQSAHAKIMGIVLNYVNIKKDGYYKYYHKYYSKYYGN